MSDVEKRPPANLVSDADDDIPPWEDDVVSAPDGRVVPVQEAERQAGHPVRGYTGRTCPECGLAQMWCPGGVSCPNGHGFGPDAVESFEQDLVSAVETVEGKGSPNLANQAASQPVPNATVTRPATSQPEPTTKPVLGPVPPDQGVTSDGVPEPTPEPEPVRPKRGVRKPKPAPTPTTVPVFTGDRSPVKGPADESYRREQREAVARRLDELVLGDGYERIIEHVFTIDPWASYEQLQKQLTLPVPAHAQTKALLFDEVDAAQLRAKEAHQLFISAKETVRRFEHDVVVMAVDMRAQATATLQAEKDAGQRSKQITDADVESRMASMFPDEWRQTEMRKSRAKLMVDHMQRLSDAWKERARDLRSLFDGK